MTPEFQNNMSELVSLAGDGGGDKKKKVAPPVTATVSTPDIKGGLSPSVDASKVLLTNQPNYTPTKDPNVVIGRNGVTITKQQFEENQKSNMPFISFAHYADWIGGWAHQNRPIPTISKYYRTYAGDNIPGSEILQLYLKHDPQIDKILDRSATKPGEVPQFAPQDADIIRQLVAKNNPEQ